MTRDCLLLRFDAPLMSFGGVTVDQRNVSEAFPPLSMITGLVGNALGYDHSQPELLSRLQDRLRFAVRRDRRGAAVLDYQTVDLGQEFLLAGWTTTGVSSGRGGGVDAKTGTHIRYREYWADAVFTLAIELDPPDEEPTLERLEEALNEPERPLFLGRKPCLPALPLILGRATGSSLRDAVAKAPLAARAAPEQEGFAAWWPEEDGPAPGGASQLRPIADERDWFNQVHVGRRLVWHGRITTSEVNLG